MAQPADDLAFERIINMPKRGLGEAAIRQVHDTSRARGIRMLAAAEKLAEKRGAEAQAARRAARARRRISRAGRSCSTTKPHTELAEIILEKSGYTDMWQNDRSAEAPGRLENLKELIRSMEEYEIAARLPRACRAGHGRRAEREPSTPSRS